jgi:hypothetical protein
VCQALQVGQRDLGTSDCGLWEAVQHVRDEACGDRYPAACVCRDECVSRAVSNMRMQASPRKRPGLACSSISFEVSRLKTADHPGSCLHRLS